LQTVGKLEAEVRVGAKPLPDQMMELELRNYRSGYVRLSHQFIEYSDQQGRVAFEAVPPVTGELRQRLLNGSLVGTMNVQVPAGATARVKMGGSGRPVTGRLVLPEGTGKLEWSLARTSLSRRGPDIPAEVRSQPEELRNQ